MMAGIEKRTVLSCPQNKTKCIKDKILVLINPVSRNEVGLTVNSSSSFPPLSLGILAALTPDNFTVKLIDENMEPFAYQEADIVGITAFTSAAGRAYEIASIYREKGIPVVMGGIHASMLPEEALRFVDTVVVGEAEHIWPQVLADFLKGSLKPKYAANHTELDNFPVPRRDLFSRQYIFATVQTSRGCPMDCYFCSVTAFNGRKYRQRPYQEVLAEIAGIPQRYLFFIDDNIIGYSKDSTRRAIQLFKGMVERKLNKAWFCQASLNFGLDEEVLTWAQKAGCKMVFIGLESADPEELKAMNKKVNLKIEYDQALKNINKHKIVVLGAFINGTEAETEESLKRKTDYILKHHIDVIQATILTPLPGTRLFNKLKQENRLLYTDFPQDWGKYDMSELTFKLDKMENVEFLKINHKCIKRFYSKWNLLRQFMRTLLHTKSMESAMWAYNANRNYRNVFLSYRD
jgi:radical SAM superfamily enzyme YgiQ (UPF0313 family)